MQPILRRDTAFAEMFAFEDLLAHDSDHQRVLHIVIQGITIRDVFERHASRPGDDPRVGWFEDTVCAAIVLLQEINKALDQQLRGVEHRPCSSFYPAKLAGPLPCAARLTPRVMVMSSIVCVSR